MPSRCQRMQGSGDFVKIMQLLPELNSGGVEGATLDMAAALVAAGHESVVISNGGRLVPALEAAGSRHMTLPIHRKSLASLFQIRPLRRLIQAEQPDIVHVRSRVPAWILALALRPIPLARRPKLVCTVHGFYSVNRYSQIMTQADRVIAVSDSVVAYIQHHYPACPAMRIQRIYEGIQPAQWPHGYQPSAHWWQKTYEEFPELEHKRWLTLPGRITRLKGHVDFIHLIKALSHDFPEIHGVIVGGADEKKITYLQELEALIAAEGVSDRITFTGARQDMREWLAASELVFSLSTQAETFGRTVLEAVALGRPVIGWDRGGVSEILSRCFPEGKLPITTPDKQPITERERDALEHKTREFLRHPPQVAPIQDFLLEQCQAETLALYESLCRSGGKKFH